MSKNIYIFQKKQQLFYIIKHSVRSFSISKNIKINHFCIEIAIMGMAAIVFWTSKYLFDFLNNSLKINPCKTWIRNVLAHQCNRSVHMSILSNQRTPTFVWGYF